MFRMYPFTINQLTMNSEQNPFDKSFQSDQLQAEEDNNRLPVSLDRANCDGANTPISRFSDLTNHNQFLQEQHKDCGPITFEDNNQTLPIMCDNELKAYVKVLQKRNEEMAIALEKQKIKNSHIEQAFNLIKREDLSLLKKLQEQTDRANYFQQALEKEQANLSTIAAKYQRSRAEVTYVKELILLANNNYEELEKKYSQVLEKGKRSEEEHALREKQMGNNVEEMKNILTNLIKNPVARVVIGGQQNRRSQFATLKSPRKDAEEVYRKMFLKTLKVKK